jgi:hypothetical protein
MNFGCKESRISGVWECALTTTGHASFGVLTLCKRLAEREIGEPVLTYCNYRAWKTSPQPALRRHNGLGCWGELKGLERELLR